MIYSATDGLERHDGTACHELRRGAPARASRPRDLARGDLHRDEDLDPPAHRRSRTATSRELPAPTFTRGFIRAYSRHLGIDPEEKVNAYLADLAGALAGRAVGQEGRARARASGAAAARRRERSSEASPGCCSSSVSSPIPERRPQPPRERAAAARRPGALKNVTVSSEPTPAIRSDESRRRRRWRRRCGAAALGRGVRRLAPARVRRRFVDAARGRRAHGLLRPHARRRVQALRGPRRISD